MECQPSLPSLLDPLLLDHQVCEGQVRSRHSHESPLRETSEMSPHRLHKAHRGREGRTAIMRLHLLSQEGAGVAAAVDEEVVDEEGAGANRDLQF